MAVSGHGHSLGRLFKEAPRQRPPVVEPMLLGHKRDLDRIVGPSIVDSVVDTALPSEAPPDRRAVDQVGHVDHEQRVALARPLVQVVDDPPAELSLAIGVPGPKVDSQCLANQLVQGETVSQRFGE